MRSGTAACVVCLLFVAACGSSAKLSSPTIAKTGGTTAGAVSGGGVQGGAAGTGSGKVTVSGADTGSFDTVTQCSIAGGGSGLMFVQMTGSVGGQKATLSLDNVAFAPGTFNYPVADSAVSPGMSADVVGEDPAKGSWHFYSTVAPGLIGGYNGGVISVTEVNGDELHFTIGTDLGTTDATGPIHIQGELRCTAIIS